MAHSPLYCDACGSANRIQATFCYFCGHPFRGQSTMSRQVQTGLLAANQLLKQRYCVLARLGKGGFGAVYKASDTLFGNRLVAIKEMSQQGLDPQELIEATNVFKHEAMLLASLTHPNLPRIYEQFTDRGRWYLVMDFIEGETLEDHLLKVVGGKLSVKKAVEIGIYLCNVLEYLHNRNPPVIFRDLKPANIMLTPTGHIYLIDFGIARHFKPGQTRDTSALGSTGYAAPEQYGKAQTTPRADIYALGATLHELLTGLNPSDSPFHFAPLHLPEHPSHTELEQLILQMIEVDVNKRPANVAQIRQSLEKILAFTTVAPASFGTNGTGGYRLARVQPPKRNPATSNHNVTFRPLSNTRFIGTKHTSRITSVAWSARNDRIASASYDKTVRIWDTVSGENLLTYQGHWDRVLTVAWSPDGSLVASAGNDGTIQIWNPLTANLIMTYREHNKTTLALHNKPILALSWSPDGKRIASVCEDKTVLIWDTITGQTLYKYEGHSAKILTLGWSYDGQYIASSGEDKLVHVWSVQYQKANFFTSWLFRPRDRYIYRGHFGRVNALAWSPLGQRLASVSSDKTLQIWDGSSGRKYFIHRNPTATITCVAWSYDGRYLATGGNDRLIHVWDTVTRNSITTYAGHTGYITSVTWSPDGKLIGSASVDHSIHVWQP